jgi:hypothetical protein
VTVAESGNSTSASVTPFTLLIAFVTVEMQCPQVMPEMLNFMVLAFCDGLMTLGISRFQVSASLGCACQFPYCSGLELIIKSI